MSHVTTVCKSDLVGTPKNVTPPLIKRSRLITKSTSTQITGCCCCCNQRRKQQQLSLHTPACTRAHTEDTRTQSLSSLDPDFYKPAKTSGSRSCFSNFTPQMYVYFDCRESSPTVRGTTILQQRIYPMIARPPLFAQPTRWCPAQFNHCSKCGRARDQ